MTLSAHTLKERARKETGLSEFGEAPFEESLAILCGSLNEEARLRPEGVAKAEALIVSHLAERLRLEDFVARHRQALDQDVAPAIFLVGMPRSGTTALAQHLSEDPALRFIPRWESKRLVPPAIGAHTFDDQRIDRSRAEFETAFKAMPWRQKILPNNFDDAAEHGILMALTCLNLQWPTLFRVPTWTRWVLKQDMTPGYEYLARILKVLQWAKPAERWSLKLPPDLFVLNVIAQVFPRSTFVWAHRHPVESISSVCSLCEQVRNKHGDAETDPAEIGHDQLEFQATGVDRAMSARSKISETRFCDVYQTDLSNNFVGTLANLYARLGLEFTDTYRDNLTKRMEENPRGRFGAHEHNLEAFGLTESAVTARFAPYIERYHNK